MWIALAVLDFDQPGASEGGHRRPKLAIVERSSIVQKPYSFGVRPTIGGGDRVQRVAYQHGLPLRGKSNDERWSGSGCSAAR